MEGLAQVNEVLNRSNYAVMEKLAQLTTYMGAM